MDLNSWSSLYKITENLASPLVILMGVLSFLVFKNMNTQFKILCSNYIISAIAEIIGWCVYRYHVFAITSINGLNHPLVIIEGLSVGIFLCMFLKSKMRRNIVFFLVTIIVSFDLFVIFTNSINESTSYSAAILCGLLCVSGLIALYEIFNLKVTQKLIRQPDVIIVGSLVFIYSLLLIITFLYPAILDYSALIATQFTILKNILISGFSISICYAMYLKYKQLTHLKPTASPKPSLPPQGQN